MKFVTFTAVQDDGRMPIAIIPSRAQAVIAAVGRDGQRLPDVSAILIDGPTVAIDVVGSVAEVVAALESATAPPVAAAVEVAPTDLERAAAILDTLISAFDDCDEYDAVHRLWGAMDEHDAGLRLTGLVSLRALAAKLRGGG